MSGFARAQILESGIFRWYGGDYSTAGGNTVPLLDKYATMLRSVPIAAIAHGNPGPPVSPQSAAEMLKTLIDGHGGELGHTQDLRLPWRLIRRFRCIGSGTLVEVESCLPAQFLYPDGRGMEAKWTSTDHGILVRDHIVRYCRDNGMRHLVSRWHRFLPDWAAARSAVMVPCKEDIGHVWVRIGHACGLGELLLRFGDKCGADQLYDWYLRLETIACKRSKTGIQGERARTAAEDMGPRESDQRRLYRTATGRAAIHRVWQL